LPPSPIPLQSGNRCLITTIQVTPYCRLNRALAADAGRSIADTEEHSSNDLGYLNAVTCHVSLKGFPSTRIARYCSNPHMLGSSVYCSLRERSEIPGLHYSRSGNKNVALRVERGTTVLSLPFFSKHTTRTKLCRCLPLRHPALRTPQASLKVARAQPRIFLSNHPPLSIPRPSPPKALPQSFPAPSPAAAGPAPASPNTERQRVGQPTRVAGTGTVSAKRRVSALCESGQSRVPRVIDRNLSKSSWIGRDVVQWSTLLPKVGSSSKRSESASESEKKRKEKQNKIR